MIAEVYEMVAFSPLLSTFTKVTLVEKRQSDSGSRPLRTITW